MTAPTSSSTPLTHTVTGAGPAAGFVISGRSNRHLRRAARPDVPLVVALHGGTYTSEYFDIAGHSLLRRGADLDIPVIALDRPNYAGSSPLETDGSIIVANADVLGEVLGEIWAEYGADTSGIVLVGHSIGAAVVTAIAARPQSWPLLGIAISGCLVSVPQQSRAAWESLPDIPMIDLPTPMKDQVMFGPAGSYGPDMPAASHPSNALVPKAELLDITGTWIAGRAAFCAEVPVPVHHRQGEFDHLWITDPGQIDSFRTGFTAAPSVDSRIQPGSGHCIDFHRAGAAFQVGQLSFALECCLT
ncbi:alpha/beta fold hydrolase [Nakamurella sp. A5-74]|uniref:Alpha/beta fold hydrolase n=1 Tax=Nakamurella sp. A5-74 TaxID=3158264 RepID=A0AAU8DK76_9ACTN